MLISHGLGLDLDGDWSLSLRGEADVSFFQKCHFSFVDFQGIVEKFVCAAPLSCAPVQGWMELVRQDRFQDSLLITSGQHPYICGPVSANAGGDGSRSHPCISSRFGLSGSRIFF